MKGLDGVLVANGELVWNEQLTTMCRKACCLLASDGGANHLARIGLRARWVIGDLDSIRSSVRSWVGEGTIVKRDDQDRTDLDKSIAYAFDELGLDSLIVLGALGGRLDHQVGNTSLLARHARGIKLVFREAQGELFALTGRATLPAIPGETWAFWTLDPGVLVTAAGMRWPFENRSLNLVPSTSNVAEEPEIVISAAGGSVLVYRQFLAEK